MQNSPVGADLSSASTSPRYMALIPLSPIERGWPHRCFSILRDVLGPDGHGPSSSHTMAPQRIALEVHDLLGGQPDTADIYFYNSFATTGDGHRTPIAVVAGLLGLSTTDPRTPRALELAVSRGLSVQFHKLEDSREHPNALIFEARRGDFCVRMKAISIGGGNYEVVERACSSRLVA